MTTPGKRSSAYGKLLDACRQVEAAAGDTREPIVIAKPPNRRDCDALVVQRLETFLKWRGSVGGGGMMGKQVIGEYLLIASAGIMAVHAVPFGTTERAIVAVLWGAGAALYVAGKGERR